MNERLTFNSDGGRRNAPSLGRAAAPAAAVLAVEEPAVRVERRARPRREQRDWAYIFMLAFTALVFLRPQDSFPPLASLHLAELCAIGGLAATIGGRLSRGQTITRMTPELAGVIGLGAVILLMAPLSIWFGGAIGMFKEIYSKILLIYLLMVNVLSSPRRIERLTWLIVLASGYLAFRAVLDFARGVNLIEHGRVKGAVGGMFKNPNDLALNMVSVLPLAVFTALRPGPVTRRAGAGLCAFLMLGAIVVSHSRSGFVGLVAAALVLACFALRQKPGLVIGGALICALATPLLPASYWHRLESITDDSQDDTGSKEARRQLLHESAQAFIENPLTGVGAGQFKNWNPDGRDQPWRESHDVILQVASELGIFGLAVFLFLVARALQAGIKTRQLLRRAKRALNPRRPAGAKPLPVPEVTREDLAFFDGHSAAILASVAGWIVCALFASVAYNWTFYYLLALAATPRDVLAARFPRSATPRVAPAAHLEAVRA